MALPGTELFPQSLRLWSYPARAELFRHILDSSYGAVPALLPTPEPQGAIFLEAAVLPPVLPG